jgi:hypothetical protein
MAFRLPDRPVRRHGGGKCQQPDVPSGASGWNGESKWKELQKVELVARLNQVFSRPPV